MSVVVGKPGLGARRSNVRRRPGHDHRQVVAHEVAHAVARPSIGRPGIFLDEGLAEVIANWVLFSEGVAPGDEPVVDLVRANRAATRLEQRRVPTLSKLLKLSFARFHGDGERDHYDLAWSFARHAAATPADAAEPSGPSLLDRLLVELRQRSSARSAFRGPRRRSGGPRSTEPEPPPLRDDELLARLRGLSALQSE